MLDRIQRATPVLLAMITGLIAVSVILQAVMLITVLRLSDQVGGLSNDVKAIPVASRKSPLPVTIMNRSSIDVRVQDF